MSMRWLKSKKTLLRSAFCLTVFAAGSASASLLPGTPSIGDILGGGSGSGTFYDFETVFETGQGGSGLFGNIFGGTFGKILGGDGGQLTSPCGIIIMNFGDTRCASEEGEYGNIFDTVFDTVSDELGIPGEISDIVTGRASVESVFQDILNKTLKDVGLSSGTNHGSQGDVIGSQGLPDPGGLLDVLLANAKTPANPNGLGGSLPNDGSKTTISANVLAAPSVNAALASANTAQRLLTEATTNRGLSEKGQAITEARMTAAQTVSRTSAKAAEASTKAAADQMTAAVEMDTTIREQTSTQDTLKEALSGINLMQAQSTELAAQANNQRALSSQLDSLALQVDSEMRDGVFSNGRSLQVMNDQMLGESQQEMAEKASVRAEAAQGLRMFGVYR